MNVLITGASTGIGFELARQFDHKGHRVIAVSRNNKKLQELAVRCSKENPASSLVIHSFDLEELTDKVSDFRNILENEMQELDILINNAGYLVRKDFIDTDSDEIHKCLTINYIVPARLIAACLPLLKKSARAHVINIGSMGGYQGSKKFPGLSHYSSAKAALSVLTECLAEEYNDTRIRFNCLALGAVQTEMLDRAFPGLKVPVTAEGIAAFIIDFAISGYDYFNGKIIPVSVTTP
jgi:short-subunit dehydrogenase